MPEAQSYTSFFQSPLISLLSYCLSTGIFGTHQRVLQPAGVHQILGCIMYCLSCGSTKQTELTAEMMIHFRGLEHRDNPGVLLYPEIRVCLGCGLSRFTVPETELALITRIMLENKSDTLKESAGDVTLPLRIAY